NCHQDQPNLGDQLDDAGLEWRQYGEDMGSPCSATNSGHYAAKHIPFLYYDDIYGNASRCANRVRPYTDFAADLGTKRFSYISPNLCNDMHDDCGSGAVAQGDAWAGAQFAPILAQPGFAAGGRDVLFVVWDEGEGAGSAVVPFIVVSPLVRSGAITTTRYDHYSLLATWEDGFGMPRLGMAGGASPISDIWN